MKRLTHTHVHARERTSQALQLNSMLENAGVLPTIQKQGAGPDAAKDSDENTSTASAKNAPVAAKGGGTQAAKKVKRRKGGKKKSKK